MEQQKMISTPPEKVLAMYQAVVEYINEGSDINTLKVADITARAGIGKGTAYEYFASKEELISASILYYVQECVGELQKIASGEQGFRQKINDIMDFIDDHIKDKQGVFFLIKIVLESYEIPKNLKDEFEQMKQNGCEKEKNEILDSLVADGIREGIIKEENVFLRRAALETQMSVYFMYRIAAEKKIELDLEADSMREYIYQNIQKLIG